MPALELSFVSDYAGYRLDVSCLVADETFSPVMMLVRQQEERLAH